MAAVTICSDFGAQEKSVTVSIVSPPICHEVMGPDAIILAFWMWCKPDFSMIPMSQLCFSIKLKMKKIDKYVQTCKKKFSLLKKGKKTQGKEWTKKMWRWQKQDPNSDIRNIKRFQ